MGSTAFVLKAILGIDTSEYENGLNDAKGKAHSFGGAIGNGLKTAAKLGGAALVGATTAVTAFGAASVKTGAEFDKSMSQVAATMGMTVEDLKDSTSQAAQDFQKLRDFALETGRTTAFSASQASEALNYMALAGYDVKTSMEMLPNVLNLAASGNMDLARASDMVTDAATAFGLVMEDGTVDIQRTTQMVDEMAKAASTGNTSVEQLGDAFLTVGGLAKELNGGMIALADGTTATYDNVQELEIALTAMANAGIKGSEAGTHMRNMLLKLASPTEDGYKAFTQLGVSVFDSEGKMRSLAGIMEDLDGAMANLTQEEKLQAISDIFNTRDTAAAEALMSAVGQDWDKIGESILNAKDAAQQMADTQLDNLAGSVTLFKSALEGAQIAVSDKLAPSFKEFVDFGASGLSKITEAFKSDGLTGAMAVFGDVLSDGLAMVVSKTPEVINAAITLLGSFGKGLIDNTPMIVDAAVNIVVKLADGLVKGLPELAKGAVTLVKSLGQAFKDNAAELQSVGASLLDLIVDGLSNGIPQLIIDFATALTNPSMISSLLESAVNIIMALAQGLLAAIPQLIAAVPVIIQNLIDGIVESAPMLLSSAVTLIGMLLQGIIENLPLILASGIRIVSSLIDGIISLVPALATTGIQLIGELIATIMRCFPKLVTNGMEIVKAIIEGILGHISTFAKTAIELINQFIKAIVSSATKIANAGKDIVNFIKDGFMQKVNEAKQWGKDLIDNFIGGIVEKANALKDTVTGAAGLIKDYIGFSEPEKGPLSNFHTFAPDMMQLFAQGIRDNENLVADQLRKSFDFKDTILESTGEYNVSATAKSDSRIISLLQRIADSDKDVKIVLEGDTRRLFRAMQSEARIYQNTTGQNAFA